MHINEKIKATALCIAAAIYPPFNKDDPEFPDYADRSETLYLAVDKLEFSDEQKADLYSCLEEELTPETSYGDALYIIEREVYYCYTH
jgi:hypothetical protein